MKIELKKLTLQYFKGAKELTVDFGHRTNISGVNASGKTRLFDLFTWILFGKDSEDRKDFNIKCLDKDNNPVHRVDTVGTAVISVDGMDMKFNRIYKEKWTKKRGEETAEFNGHETAFFVNGVPLQLKDYQEKVESILPESLFKQVTNPAFFNSMKWTDRRAMLFEMAGKITDQDIIATSKELKVFYESITSKTFDEFKKELAAKKKLLKESIQNIPARIDEVNRAIVPDPDYKQTNLDIDKLSARLLQIDGLIASDSEKFNEANRKNQEVQNKIFSLKQQIQKLEFEDKGDADKARNETISKQNGLSQVINQFNGDFLAYQNQLLSIGRTKQPLIEENERLRGHWSQINGSELEFGEDQFNCPACKRPLEAADIEIKKAELRVNFNISKIRELETIDKRGKANKAEIERLSGEVLKIQDQIDDKKLTIVEKQSELDLIIVPATETVTPNPQIKVLHGEIIKIEGTITTLAKTDNSALIQEKAEINNAVDVLKKTLNVKEQNEKLKIRRSELIDSEKSLSQQIADIEKQEFQCEVFTRAKINMIEEKVNSLFSLVKFKMFNELVNGGQEEVCEALINGVPYQDANNAARINSGIDIIRTLSKHYDVYAPIFIDNAEACNEIIDADSQMIKLYVTEDKELKVLIN